MMPFLNLAAKMDQVQSILRHHVLPDKNLLITALESGELDTLNEDTVKVGVSSSVGGPPVVTVEGADVLAWNFIAVSAHDHWYSASVHDLKILALVKRHNPRHQRRPFARSGHAAASESNRTMSFNGRKGSPQVIVRT